MGASQGRGPEKDRCASQVRLVTLVIASTLLAWMAAQWLGGEMGWGNRLVLLSDLAALAALGWAMVVTYQIWRGRQG
jgi:high-affinity Fe2+/Pb2+ permease